EVLRQKMDGDGLFSYQTRFYTNLPGQVGAESAWFRPGESVQLTIYAYDGLGRMTRASLPDDNFTDYAYGYLSSEPGTTVRITNPRGAVTEIDTNQPGQTTARTDFDRATSSRWTTSYTYGPFGLVSTISPPNNFVSTAVQYTYDALGRRITVVDPDAGTRR